MADEQLRQEKHGKPDMKSVKESVKQKPSDTSKKKAEDKISEQKSEEVKETKIEDKKEAKEEKKTEKKVEFGEQGTSAKKSEVKVKAPKKHEVSVHGRSLPISLRHSKGIGKFIRGKKIDDAIHDLELIIRKKKAVPMTGEMAHKKGKGMATGKYPVKASENFIRLLKSLSANGVNHGMELENTRIAMVVPNKAPKQVHRGGRMKFKRTHVKIIAKEGKK